MQPGQANPTKMTCPECGFHVFNRRYPKCERCKSDLPASLLYSEVERRTMLEAEKVRLTWELKQPKPQGSRKASRRGWTSNSPGIAAGQPSLTNDGGTVSALDGFASAGGGVFDGGGASGSFGGDSGSSGSSD